MMSVAPHPSTNPAPKHAAHAARPALPNLEAVTEYQLLVEFLKEKQYDAALELLIQARTRYPCDRALDRSITLLRHHLEVLRTRAEGPRATQENLEAAGVNQALQSLESMDGFVGASLVDSQSGTLLGLHGGGDYPLELASTLNTEVVAAKRRAMEKLGLGDQMEDILITLKDQYHLIRPLRSRPAVFLYLVTLRAKSNLALARMQLADCDRAVEF